MDRHEKNMKLYHDQIFVLIKSIKGKNFAGKIFRNNQRVKEGWFHAAKNILLKMVELDESSEYVKKARKVLYSVDREHE